MRRIILMLAMLASVVAGTGVASAATDPRGDVARCPGLEGSAGDAPDLVRAVGEIVELGTSIRWTLTFAEPLAVPDQLGRPFRVDVLLYDPKVPALSFGYYHGTNRLLRYDAVADPVLVTLLLPERGESRFIAPEVDGTTMTFRIPGRALTEDEEEDGTSPGLGAMRWSVITRDGAACDLLGDGRPRERLVTIESTRVPSGVSGPERHGSDRLAVWMVMGVAIAIVAAIAIAAGRRSRRDASSTRRS